MKMVIFKIIITAFILCCLGFFVWVISKLKLIWPIEKVKIEKLEFILQEGKYSNGGRYHHLEFGAKGVIKSYPIWESDFNGIYSEYVDSTPFLHNANTGECYRNGEYNIINYPKQNLC